MKRENTIPFESPRLRVLFFTREGPGRAGFETRTKDLCDALRERGIDAAGFSLEGQDRETGRRRRKTGARIRSIFAAYFGIRRFRPDVVVLQRVNAHLPPALAAWSRSGFRLVLDVDDWEFREDLRHYPFGVSSSKGETLMRWLSRAASHTVVASRFLEEYMEPWAARLSRIPSGVNGDRFRPAERRDRTVRRALWCGSLDPERREVFEDLVEFAAAFAGRARRGLEFRIVCRGALVPELKRRVSSLGSPAIRVVENVSRGEMPACLGGAEAGILPLFRRSRFYRAKSPVKLYEYLASGLIPLAAPVGEAAAVIDPGKTGELAGDPESMVERLNVLSHKPAAYVRETARRCRELFEKEASLARAADRWKAVLERRA
jgi:glycosyltransferase involved in cell wall biosynthesis